MAAKMLASEPGQPIRIWIAAAISATALHTGALALAIVTLQPDDAPDELGSNAIEIDYVRTAPKVDAADLPAGPDADASAASPASEEQKEVVKDTSLPKAPTTDTDDPDRTATPDKSLAENAHETPKTPAPASAPAIAAEATATPSSQTAVASRRSAAPERGSGDSLRRLRTTWQKELAAHLDNYKRYPADRDNMGAEIVLSFELDRTGHVRAARIVKGSGDASFDAAALAMMRRADPVPAPPPHVADDGLTFTLPVIFRATARK